MNRQVFAVIVAFNSELHRITELLSVITCQCSVVVVDNSIDISHARNLKQICSRFSATYLSLTGNFGIAYAQNVGVMTAKKNGAVDLLFLDDDSIPSSNFLADLIFERKLIQHTYDDVVVCPRAIDAQGNSLGLPGEDSDHALITELTSSGSLVPMILFEKVGYYDSDLFIDCVDFEWGWLAIKQGSKIVRCNRVKMEHRLGINKRFGFRISSPIRLYYQFRNVMFMIFGRYAPLRWRLQQSAKLPLKFILTVILSDHKLTRIWYIYRGFSDFIFGIKGKFNG